MSSRKYSKSPRTFNIYGGRGGSGGEGCNKGGDGGTGEGPTATFFDISAGSVSIRHAIAGAPRNGSESDFRSVPLGDLNLIEEIDKQALVVYRPVHRKKRGAVKRYVQVAAGTRTLHRARIVGFENPMTVALNSDSKFEEMVSKTTETQQYRHPLLAQLFGITRSSSRLNAPIYHDDLVPSSQIVAMHAHSSFLVRHYVSTTMWVQVLTAGQYWKTATRADLDDLPGTLWVRMSSGTICVEIGNGSELFKNIRGKLNDSFTAYSRGMYPSIKLTENDLNEKLHRAVEPHLFHYLLLDRTFWHDTFLSHGAISLPSLWISNGGNEYDLQHLAQDLFPHDHCDGFEMSWRKDFNNPMDVMPTGWVMLEWEDKMQPSLTIGLNFDHWRNVEDWWYSQQHHLRQRVGRYIDSDMRLHLAISVCWTLALPDRDAFTLRGTFMSEAPPDPVYLFMFHPPPELSGGQITIPLVADADMYYWAWDAEGLERLTHETVEEFGLPTGFRTRLYSRWREEEEDSAAITEYQLAKGFNPDSQELAIKYGYSLLDVDGIVNSARQLFGHQDEEDVDDISMPGSWKFSLYRSV
ncbi:hypothetical protein FB45DRAFT_340048 [Roridomyces roridus]|uniref:Uncharacterized protein n=1 Tax=Roridomyces roridus TaxID=1738132 RepID=A0AAD7B4V3_9AGAR|nr:hypothetical protein FB45DRAFT_340048 [Roridomyces roridus]